MRGRFSALLLFAVTQLAQQLIIVPAKADAIGALIDAIEYEDERRQRERTAERETPETDRSPQLHAEEPASPSDGQQRASENEADTRSDTNKKQQSVRPQTNHRVAATAGNRGGGINAAFALNRAFSLRVDGDYFLTDSSFNHSIGDFSGQETLRSLSFGGEFYPLASQDTWLAGLFLSASASLVGDRIAGTSAIPTNGVSIGGFTLDRFNLHGLESTTAFEGLGWKSTVGIDTGRYNDARFAFFAEAGVLYRGDPVTELRPVGVQFSFEDVVARALAAEETDFLPTDADSVVSVISVGGRVRF